ncbi:unnamed protein product [Rhizoctonia solani]|uniref:non-specific serine/threonine protein kinase n=1 Tax=Rhizoctonia solani TaxID=456999 RepID=A0A8H3CCT4_9AGAM|nr:unnamed protein product [Rhizoctonia solani]
MPVAQYNNISYVSGTRVTIRKDIRLGSGGFAHVFRAIQSDTQRIVALKQCRASLKLKRPHLQHEAQVLRILSGHPSIPDVYAYGRIQHFELMSMQLLHRSLGDVVKESGPMSVKMVANIAFQMMDALQHVHLHGLVHRDIKPDNIMLQNPDNWKICLIDFGLTRSLPSPNVSIEPTVHKDSDSATDSPAYVFGTLPFASLNAHEKDSQLTFRDDLESLAYTLIWLLRGSLPWSYYAKCGTRIGRIRQVFAQKKHHTGFTLTPELPTEFGELVDYARALSLDEKLEHAGWRRRFKQVESNASDNPSVSEHRTLKTSNTPPEPPVEVGQIVLVKLNPSITADGYTIREGHESSFILDPVMDGPEWSTTYKPAVVVQVEWDKWASKYRFITIAISRTSDQDEGATIPIVSIAATGSNASNLSPMVHIEPEWPFKHSCFYVFKRPVMFYCLPSQERIYSTWRIAPSDCDNLLKALAPLGSLSHSQVRQNLKSLDPDIRHDARMKESERGCNLYAQVYPLTRAHLEDDSIDWLSTRAWFDECAIAMRYFDLNLGIWWTGAWFPAVYERKEGEVSDSYSELDYSMWEAQSERAKSITLGINDRDIEGTSGPVLGLAEIVTLEHEPQAGKSQRN